MSVPMNGCRPSCSRFTTFVRSGLVSLPGRKPGAGDPLGGTANSSPAMGLPYGRSCRVIFELYPN
jgi:hypothetical protein